MSQSLFERQREMRHRREAAVKRGTIAVLDIGTSKVTCLILQFANDTDIPRIENGVRKPSLGAFRVVGVGTTRARGIKFGEIDRLDEAEKAIRTAVQKAQKMSGVRVDHAIACMSGGRPRSYGLDGQVQVEQGEVSERDIGHVLSRCDVPDYGAMRDAIHAMPVNFTLDHRTGLTDPRGQIGYELAVDMHMLTVDTGPLHNLSECCRRCDLELAGISFAPYCSGIAALTEDEAKLGAACIDMGAGTTGIAVFVKSQLIYADSVRLGGNHVTGDICQGLQVPSEIAERLKTLQGGVVATGADDRDMIEIPTPLAQWENERRRVSRAELIGIMRPRVEEILEEARDRLEASGFEYLPSRTIVLTGGSNEIPGLQDLAGRIFGEQVYIRKPMRVQGLPQATSGPAFAAPIGLALNVSHPQDECWDFEIPHDGLGVRQLRRAMRWFRDNL